MSSKSLPVRAEVDLEHTWDTASVYPTAGDYEAAVDALLARLPEIQAYRGRLGASALALAEILQTIERYVNDAMRALMFATVEYSVDTTDQAAAARLGRARTLEGQVRGAVAFVEPELMGIGFETLRQWVREESSLAHYGHFLDRLEHLAPHVRSAEVEELLGMVADPFGTARATHGVLANSEMRFAHATTSSGEPLEVAQGTVNALLTHADREVRRTAWENYADGHLNLKNSQANCIAAAVKQHVFVARARRYPSSLEAAAGSNYIPVTVFHNLLETFKRNLPIWHRYWRLRRRVMGLDTLREYDVRAPLVEDKLCVPYAQAIEWICAGMQPMGEEYVGIVRRGCLDERWVDIYPSKGKGEGAYSSGCPGTLPFIFINYNNDLFSMSTLAHELGHSLHSYYTWRTQPLVYADYTIFAAEVASNFNQVMVRDYLLRTQTERSIQIAILEEALSNFHRYFFVMPTLARFELAIHARVERNQPLTADWMSNHLADLLAEAYGDEVSLDRTRTGITWAQFPTHMYLDFYVYQYATGIAGAHALARRVLDGEPGAAARYIEFLKSGTSLYPLDALRRAGVDLSTPLPVEATFAELSGYVDRLEALLA